jgi:beta-glucosidase
MQKPILVAILTLLASAPACKSGADSGPTADVPTSAALMPEENSGMHERNLELVERAKAHPDAEVVFIGDSITHGWDDTGRSVWEREFAPMNALNLGVSGDRTEHVLWRLQQGAYDALRPRVIVMMIGTNNTGHRMDPPQDIADGVGAILTDLHERFPKAKLALLAIFPREATLDDPMRQNNAAANALLMALARERNVHWLDVSAAFCDADGTLSQELMPDLLHPNEQGYEAWASAMVGPLRGWMR